MSKSLGNTVDPLEVMKEYGADIIRLWALSVDYTEDHRIGPEILKGVADQYRKLRNTFRYLLGALDGFAESERVSVEEMPELERYVLFLLAQLDATLKQAVDDFDFNTYTRALIDFCNEDLSAFYFDIRKDSLYCDAPGDPRRRACGRCSTPVPSADPLCGAAHRLHRRGSVANALPWNERSPPGVAADWTVARRRIAFEVG
jgi:isoleucyl-tRNA synthetase